MQAGFALIHVAGDPVGHALAGDAHGRGDVGLGRRSLMSTPKQEAAVNGGAGITVGQECLRGECGP